MLFLIPIQNTTILNELWVGLFLYTQGGGCEGELCNSTLEIWNWKMEINKTPVNNWLVKI